MIALVLTLALAAVALRSLALLHTPL